MFSRPRKQGNTIWQCLERTRGSDDRDALSDTKTAVITTHMTRTPKAEVLPNFLTRGFPSRFVVFMTL